MALALSILALFATFYQAHLQRVHNQKSVKPLTQIDLVNRDGFLAIYVRNNGIGPYIIKKLEFSRNGETFEGIEDCLSINPKIYQSIPVTKYTPKTILPGASFDVFSLQCSMNDPERDVNVVKDQLSVLKMKVTGVDIYDNTIIIERSFDWFSK